MAKYEAQIADLKNRLSQVTKVNILLPEKNTVDNLAAGLSLMLALKASGKEALVVTQDPLLVSQANLFGAGEVKSTLPADSGSNFVITLGGVVDNQGLVPAL